MSNIGPRIEIFTVKTVSIIAIVLSSAALAVTLFNRVTPPDSVLAESVDDSLRLEVEELRERLAALENSNPTVAKQTSVSPEIEQKVEELADSQMDLAELTLSIDSLGVLETQERELVEAYQALLDESRPAGERVKRAQLLKRYGQFDEQAVESMWKLFSEAKKPYDQAAALTALKGHISVDRLDDVVAALNQDTENGYKNGRLRYFGVEALQPLLNEPAAKEQLTFIAQNDPEPKIAARAARLVGLPVQKVKRTTSDRRK